MQHELNSYFEDRGLNCEGFLLSKVILQKGDGKDEILVKHDIERSENADNQDNNSNGEQEFAVNAERSSDVLNPE